MSLYVTLPSNGGGKEFETTNTNASFKVRLPERLRLKHEPWEVALASISLPTLGAVPRRILHKFPPTTQVGFLSGLLAYEGKDAPPDWLDRLAKQHDIDYARAKNLRDKHAADRKMIRAIDRLKKKTKSEKVVKKIMQTKVHLKL